MCTDIRLPLLAKRIVGAAIWTVIWLTIFNIFGVLIAFLLDVFLLGNSHPGVFYGVWLTLGVLCGFTNFKHCGAIFFGDMKEWRKHPDASDKGFLVFCITGVVVGTVLLLCRRFAWSGMGDIFVPDSQWLSMTYYVSMLIATGIAYRMIR